MNNNKLIEANLFTKSICNKSRWFKQNRKVSKSKEVSKL